MERLMEPNELTIFESEQFGQVRTITKDGNVWFAANDVCRALEIVNSRDAITRLDDDEKMGVALTDVNGREQITNVINEAGLYMLVLSSRKKEAKAFKRWVTHDVIPSIRKRGLYATDAVIAKIFSNPDFGIRLLNEIKGEREKNLHLIEQNERQQMQIEQMKPKVLFADSLCASKTSILVGDLAKILKQRGVKIGATRLFAWMRENGYLIRQRGSSWNMPTQRSMEMGLFEVIERTVNNPDGSIRLTRTAKVTGKGQIYFVNKFTADKKGA